MNARVVILPACAFVQVIHPEPVVFDFTVLFDLMYLSAARIDPVSVCIAQNLAGQPIDGIIRFHVPRPGFLCGGARRLCRNHR